MDRHRGGKKKKCGFSPPFFTPQVSKCIYRDHAAAATVPLREELPHHEYKVVAPSNQSKSPDWAAGETSQHTAHCTLLSKQGRRRREKTFTEKEGTRTTRVPPPPPPTPSPSPFYLLKLWWVVPGSCGAIFHPACSPHSHPEKQHARRGASCRGCVKPSVPKRGWTAHAHETREENNPEATRQVFPRRVQKQRETLSYVMGSAGPSLAASLLARSLTPGSERERKKMLDEAGQQDKGDWSCSGRRQGALRQ